jgi:hypothetical protein
LPFKAPAPEGAFFYLPMKPHSTLLRTLYYAVGFTAFLMIPMGLVLLWLSKHSSSIKTSNWEGITSPGLYMETASYAIMSLGLLLLTGVIAFSKNKRPGKVLLSVGCAATVVFSAVPAFQLATVLVNKLLVSAVLVSWVVFILPYVMITYLIHRNG